MTRRSALPWALLLTASCAPRPTGDDLYAQGLASLQQGDLKRAHTFAEQGWEYAHRRRQADQERQFRVLQAEVLVAQRQQNKGLELLAGLGDFTSDSPTMRIRALMTRGFAICLSSNDSARNRAADDDLVRARQLAAMSETRALDGEVALRMGSCALSRREVAVAEAHFQQARQIARQQQRGDLEANSSGSIGLLRLSTGHYDEAVTALEQALELARRVRADSTVMKVLANLGLCHYYLGDYDRAIALLEEADSMAFAAASAERRPILNTLGCAYFLKEQYGAALTHFERALAVARQAGDRKQTGRLLSNLSEVALRQGHLARATSRAQQAVETLEDAGDPAALQLGLLNQAALLMERGQVAAASQTYRRVAGSPDADDRIRWGAHTGLAQIFAMSGQPVEAEMEYQRALAIMEHSRARLSLVEHRISFFSTLGRFYDGYVGLLVSHGKIGLALDVVDRSRARQLREKLDQETKTKVTTRGQYETTAKQLDAAVLFYSLAAEQSYLWMVTPRQITLHRLPAEKEIGEHVERYRSLVLRSGDPLVEESTDGRWLYETLVGPVAHSITPGARVLVVPDGALHQINFETLVVPAPTPHFWIEDVTLATAPSLGLLEAANMQKGVREEGRRPILLVGDPVASGDEFPSLPYAGREMERIAAQFSPAQTTTYAGAQAVPDVYKQSKPERFSYIHFAAHAKPSSESPLDSAIVLSPKDDTFKLYAREIVNIPVQADLVTLSACYGAGARNYSGEGFVGLAWAFMSSGAKNVIAALWNVEDASTAELMEGLYRGLADGEPPPEALRVAKLKLIHSQTAHRKPFYWAPFVTYTRQWRSREPAQQRLARTAAQ